MVGDIAQSLLMEWSGVKAVDHHCHPLRRWPFQLSAQQLRAAFSEALDPALVDRHVAFTAGYRGAVARLARELGCAATEAALLECRNAAEPARYASQLLAKTATDCMLVDRGFASSESFTSEAQEHATGIRQHEIVRLETLAETLVPAAADPREWFAATRSALRDAIARGAVGVKTICAYRASLKLRRVDTDELGEAFRALRLRAVSGDSPRLSGNALCHALLFEAAEECIELDVPLQVHCGFGDPDEDLAETSPLGLRPLFVEPPFRGLRIALLHCYPYHREAAYLCAVFPGAYMDLSLTIPFAALEGVRAMKETLGLCPTSKLLYASDASRYPEVFFVASTIHREALAEALAELVERGILSRDEAVAAGGQVLRENARELYRLARTDRQTGPNGVPDGDGASEMMRAT
jgi:predicted TIM-barrel fold metal-dependent hydrolase